MHSQSIPPTPPPPPAPRATSIQHVSTHSWLLCALPNEDAYRRRTARAPGCVQLKSQPLHSMFGPALVRSARCAACVSAAFGFPRTAVKTHKLLLTLLLCVRECVREKLLAQRAPGSITRISSIRGHAGSFFFFFSRGRYEALRNEVDVPESKVRSGYLFFFSS